MCPLRAIRPRHAFARSDNGNGKLSKDELKYGLMDFGVDLSDKDLESVIKTFDRNGDGMVDYDEFLIGLRGALNRRRREIILMAFDKLDKDGSGVVTMEDLRAAFHVSEDNPDVASGLCTKEQALERMLERFDSVQHDGVVTKDEFLESYKGVSASVDDDDYFELMMRNAWHIWGGEGAVENTSNLRVLVTYTDGSQRVVGIHDDLGVDKKDFRSLKSALEAQGETDIADISFTGGA